MYVEKRIAKSGTFQLRVNINRFCSVGTSPRARTYLHIGDAGISVFRTASRASTALLSLQFSFDTQSFHLIHLADGLPKIFHKFTSVMLVSSVKCD